MTAGDPVRMATVNIQSKLPPMKKIEHLSHNLTSLLPCLPVSKMSYSVHLLIIFAKLSEGPILGCAWSLVSWQEKQACIAIYVMTIVICSHHNGDSEKLKKETNRFFFSLEYKMRKYYFFKKKSMILFFWGGRGVAARSHEQICHKGGATEHSIKSYF